MAAGHDPRDNDRLVSLRARFEEAVDRMIGGSEWHGADLTTMAESACRRLDELIAADFDAVSVKNICPCSCHFWAQPSNGIADDSLKFDWRINMFPHWEILPD